MGHKPPGHFTIAWPAASADAQSHTLAICTPSSSFPDKAPHMAVASCVSRNPASPHEPRPTMPLRKPACTALILAAFCTGHGQQASPAKGQTANISSAASCKVSVTTTRLCHVVQKQPGTICK